jgi:hydrogenase nickel incorporation protein HypA/HybF
MHELALMQDLMACAGEIILQRHVTKVNRVFLSVGRFSNVLPDALQLAFESMTQDGVMKGAELEIGYFPASARCGACGREYAADGFPLGCPGCGSDDFMIISGEEVYLQRMECEVDDQDGQD